MAPRARKIRGTGRRSSSAPTAGRDAPTRSRGRPRDADASAEAGADAADVLARLRDALGVLERARRRREERD